MMMTRYFCPALLVFLSFVGACGSGRSTVTSAADLYSPLAVGNKWVYDYRTSQGPVVQTIRVTSLEMIDNVEYFRIETAFDKLPNYDDRFVRAEGNRIYEYNNVDKQEYALIDFVMKEQDTNSSRLGFVESRLTEPVTVPAGTFSDCITITFPGVDSQIITFAPEVGVVKSFWFRGTNELIEAVINGKRYPD